MISRACGNPVNNIIYNSNNPIFDLLHADDIFCHLLINFANSLYPEQASTDDQA